MLFLSNPRKYSDIAETKRILIIPDTSDIGFNDITSLHITVTDYNIQRCLIENDARKPWFMAYFEGN